MAFNDGIYYNSDTSLVPLIKISSSLWTGGHCWLRCRFFASFSWKKDTKIITLTMLGTTFSAVMLMDRLVQPWSKVSDDKGFFDYFSSKTEGVDIPIIGGMVAAWADTPSARYSPSRLFKLMRQFANSNAEYFAADYGSSEQEIERSSNRHLATQKKVLLRSKEAEKPSVLSIATSAVLNRYYWSSDRKTPKSC